jgi:hypothetical protein
MTVCYNRTESTACQFCLLPRNPILHLKSRLTSQMELEHQAGEANLLGSAMERYNLGIQDMQQQVSSFRRNGSMVLGHLGGQLADVERWVLW